MSKTEQSVMIVDNETNILHALKTSLGDLSNNIHVFDSPVKSLTDISMGKHDLLITDINMSEMNGLQVIKKAKEIDPGLAVIVMTGYADIDLAVKSLQTGADEFIEKPFAPSDIRNLVKNLLAKQLKNGRGKLRELTKSEIEILKRIVEGIGNSAIAYELHKSVRTIEDHRRNLMLKLEVTNVVELVQRAAEIGFTR